MTERERLKEERARLWEIANSLDEAWENVTDAIAKINAQIHKLREETSCESS